MKKVVLLLSLTLISCFTEPKKQETIKTNVDNAVFKNKSDEIIDNLSSPISSNQTVEDIVDNLFLETFDSQSEIINHYDGCGCYFSRNKDDFLSGNKNVFFGTFLGEQGSEIELIINNKIEKLTFVKKQKVEFKIYYKYSNSQHIATMELSEEDIEAEEGVYMFGNIIIDNKYISPLFGICGC